MEYGIPPTDHQHWLARKALREDLAKARTVIEAACMLTVLRINEDGSLVIGPQGWNKLQAALKEVS